MKKPQPAPAHSDEDMVRIATGTDNANSRMQDRVAKARVYQGQGPTESSLRAHPMLTDPAHIGLKTQHDAALKRLRHPDHAPMHPFAARHLGQQFAQDNKTLRDVRAAEAKPARDAQRRRAPRGK